MRSVAKIEGLGADLRPSILAGVPIHQTGDVLYLLTSLHGVAGNTPGKYTVKITIDGDQYKATVLAVNQLYDLALLKSKINRYTYTFSLRLTPPVEMERVLAIGCPMGFDPVITEGIVSRSHDMAGKPRWICSAPVYFGNSGGAVLDYHTKELIGISTSLMADRIGFGMNIITHLHLFSPTSEFYMWVYKELYMK